MTGKSVLVTGANTGIGRATALELARRGHSIFVAGRSEEKMRPVLDEISGARFLHLDLTDLASVRSAAGEFLSRDEPLHVLINNAGVAGQRGLTKDGFELHFGTNHLGHFLFTQLLLERIKGSAPSRIVNVSSQSHYSAKGFDWEAVRQPTKSTTGMSEYAVSKLANVLHAQELARRLDGTGVTTYSLHPGVIASDIWRRIPWPFRSLMAVFMKSTEQGAETSVCCATDPALAEVSGRYYDNCKEKAPNPVARPELARELWERSEAFTA